MIQVTFLIDHEVHTETLHTEDLQDFLDAAAARNIPIIDVS